MGIVDFQNVSFTYDGDVSALCNVTLSLEPGSFTCVLGGNGSGKSTLAKHINALLIPDSGTVKVLGQTTADPAQTFFIRSHAGMVFQNPDDQLVASVVEDDVAFGPENLGVPSDELTERVRHALARVGLDGYEKRETAALSGGQKQRVAIAGVLAMKPRILILDEAAAMLDPRGRQKLFEVCHELNSQGLTVVVITHSMNEAAHAHNVVILDKGHIVAHGTPADTLNNLPFLQSLSLDVPFATKMSSLLQERGIDVPLCLTDEELCNALKTRLPLESAAVFADACSRPSVKPEHDTPLQSDVESPAEVPLLSFEEVSFSYASKRALKEQAHSNPGASSLPAHDDSHWGNKPQNLWALRAINISVNAGDFVGIAGHTGSGKSTLIQLANGILTPTKGAVFVNGLRLTDKAALRSARHTIGVVFQYPERQLFAATVFDDVAFGPRNLGLPNDEVSKRVQDALELVHLDAQALGTRNPFALSGGQQRRVAIAGILAMNPQLLILDEPTAGLDPKSHHELMELIAELHESQNKTIMLVSHDMNDLAYRCNRLMVLSEGRIVENESPALVFAQTEKLKKLGLGLPSTLELAHCLGISCSGVPTPEELASLLAALIHNEEEA